MNPYEYLTDAEAKAVRETVAKGEERKANRELNRAVGEDEERAIRAWLYEARSDQLSLESWGARGFTSGPPDQRPSAHAEVALTSGGQYACEHGYSGRHYPAGAEVACEVLMPNTEDYWLGRVETRDPSPRPKPNNLRTHPQLDESKWGAEEDALEALMEEVPHEVQDGGGLAGIQDDYYRALRLMGAPAQVGPNSEGGSDA